MPEVEYSTTPCPNCGARALFVAEYQDDLAGYLCDICGCSYDQNALDDRTNHPYLAWKSTDRPQDDDAPAVTP